MNLRILKKLSKRAEVLLPRINRNLPEMYKAENSEECYTSSSGHERKHHERNRALYPTWGLSGTRYYMPRHGLSHVELRQPDCVLKGNVMLGWMDGYEEREWEEDDAWSVLRDSVFNHYTDIIHNTSIDDFGGYEFRRTRKLNNPAQILKAALDIATAKEVKS